ncbi:hypothetical protein BJX63DRAFT_428712 [Aspergillus granulosus]|uniref:Rhodopsin domain-containing protein n=1 Tax=Aspergillus granulosus TaxID=176169 RepID=A0ABR4HVU8_9EURO
MAISVSLRAYARLKKHQVGIDDYLLALGAVGTTLCCGALFPIFLNDVWGRHEWDIPASSIGPRYFKYSLAAGCLYNISAMFIKISILTFYFRMFSPSLRARALIWAGIVVICVMYMGLTISLLAWMVPHWDDLSPANSRSLRTSARIIDFTLGVFSVVSDFYVLAIPIAIVFRLHIATNRKIGVACIFLVGFVSLGCSIAGTIFRYHALVFDVEDIRWLSIRFQALSVTELNIGIFCACVPIFFVVLKTWILRIESGFVYLKQRLISRGDSKKSLGVGGLGVCPHHSDHHHQQHRRVALDIPRGTLTRLKSIFGKPGNNGNEEMEEAKTTIQVSQYFEVESIDYDYHAQLRRP